MGVTCFVKLQSFLFRGGIVSPSTFVKAHIISDAAYMGDCSRLYSFICQIGKWLFTNKAEHPQSPKFRFQSIDLLQKIPSQ